MRGVCAYCSHASRTSEGNERAPLGGWVCWLESYCLTDPNSTWWLGISMQTHMFRLHGMAHCAPIVLVDLPFNTHLVSATYCQLDPHWGRHGELLHFLHLISASKHRRCVVMNPVVSQMAFKLTDFVHWTDLAIAFWRAKHTQCVTVTHTNDILWSQRNGLFVLFPF